MREAKRSVPFNRSLIPLVAPEHLIIRKAILNRLRDWHDIEQILVASPGLELGEVDRWLRHMIGAYDARTVRLDQIAAALDLS